MAVSSVHQSLLFVGKENGKLMAFRRLLAEGLPTPILVFVSSKLRSKAPATGSSCLRECMLTALMRASRKQPVRLRCKTFGRARRGC